MPTAGNASTFTNAINEIKRTPRGQERTMYGPIRDLFVDILGYTRNRVRNELSAEVGVPDLTIQADSGIAGLSGAPILIPWIVVEAKDEPRAFLNIDTRESIVSEKAKYITPDTAWFVLVDPLVIVGRPVQSVRLATVADLVFHLDGTETEDKFQELFASLHAEQAGVSPLLKSFRDGDETLIATEKLTLPPAASLRSRNQVLLAQRHFFHTLRQATTLLQGACLNALQADLPQIEEIRSTVAAFKASYHGLKVNFDPLSVRGNPYGPVEARAHDREAAKLRRRLASQESLAKLALRDLEEFRARSGARAEQLVELFAIETANLILARILLIRFFEDHSFFQEKRYICNGGVKAFRGMMSYFDVGYTLLLERAYREAGSFYAAAFDETELDWVFEDRHAMLNHAIEWAMFQLSRYDFTTIRGDILTGIYDRFLEPSQRKKFGEYYTPPSIARYILDAVEVNPGDRLLDPACGSGTFLIEAYQRLVGEAADRGLKTYEDALEVLSGLAGNDLNTFSAVLTQIQLLWHLLPFKANLLTEGFPDLAITEKFNSPALQTLESHASRFAEIDQPIYDAVIGNPPYVRPERNSQVYDQQTLDFYERDISAGGNLYSLFIYRALKTWCRPEDEQGAAGRLGFVIPLSFCDGDDVAQLRRLFAPGGQWRIREIVDLESIWWYVFDADVLPMILIAENRPPGDEEEVTVRIADASCLDFQGESRPHFHLKRLPPQRLRYNHVFAPDGRILSRITPERYPIIAKIRENRTFGDIAKKYWVRFQGSRIMEARVTDPGIMPGQRWEPRQMLARGVVFRRTLITAAPGEGIDVYKGENVVALSLVGGPVAQNVDVQRADDPSFWRFPEILPAIGYGFPQVYLCPTAVRFNPRSTVFTDTVTLFFPTDELVGFPFDLLVLSRIYRFYYAIALRMGILNNERSHLYPKNLRLLPWNDALCTVANDIELLRESLLNVSHRVYRTAEALVQELGAIPCKPFQQVCLEVPGVAVAWSASLQTTGFEFTLRPPICTHLNGTDRIQLSESPQDWLEVNNPEIAAYLCLALRPMGGKTLKQRDILLFQIPTDNVAASQFEEILTTFPSRDHEQDLEAVIDQLDALVGPALGLNNEDIAYIQKDTNTDPFLSKIYPRYPYTETRRHGFRARLDRHDRYQ